MKRWRIYGLLFLAFLIPGCAQDNTDKSENRLALSLLEPLDRALQWPLQQLVFQASSDVDQAYQWHILQAPDGVISQASGDRLVIQKPEPGEYRIEVRQQRLTRQLTTVVAEQDFSYMNGGVVSEAERTGLNRLILDPVHVPSRPHPRLYGSNQHWFAGLQKIRQYDPDCQTTGVASTLGGVVNMKLAWQNRMLSGNDCQQTVPASLYQHADAKRYLNGDIDTSRAADDNLRLRLIHLIRRERFCREEGYPCRFPAAEVEELVGALVEQEFVRLTSAPRAAQAPLWADELGFAADYRFNQYWHKANTGEFMVLEAAPAFKFWCLLLDVLHQHPALTDQRRAYIESELEAEILSYLKQAEERHWSLYNGNNWTVVLNSAALHWALLNYYEQPERARRILQVVVETNWLHRDFYLADGGYLEGASYARSASYPYVMTQQRLLMAAFRQPLHSFNWLSGPTISRWLLSSVVNDNRLLDFGDAWAAEGLSGLMALELQFPHHILQQPQSQLQRQSQPQRQRRGDADDCQVRDYFTHNYYDQAFYDPWLVSPWLIRDWQQTVDRCQSGAVTGVAIFPQSGLAKLASYRDWSLPQQSDPQRLLYRQTRENALYITTTNNATPHREMDPGSLVWSAFGVRLLADFGYGRIARNYYEYDLFEQVSGNYYNHLDHMLGGNNLVLPEAMVNYQDGGGVYRYQYQGQVYGYGGELSQPQLGNGVVALHADLTPVYSQSDGGRYARPAVEGKLSNYGRWLIALDDAFLLVDRIEAKAGTHTLAEDWFYLISDDISDCQGQPSRSVDATLVSPSRLTLESRCHPLSRSAEQRIFASIDGFGLQEGAFTNAVPGFWPRTEPFFSDSVSQRDGKTALAITNQLNRREYRQLWRWQPQQAVATDTRVFVLQASDQAGDLLPVTMSSQPCSSSQCLRVNVGERHYQLSMTVEQGKQTISRVEEVFPD